MQAHIAVKTKPKLILPNKKKILRKCLRGDDYNYAKEREHNKYLGKRSYQIHMFSWSGEVIARFRCDEESDIIELFIQIHTPGAFPYREYNIDPNEIGDVQLFITQALTTGAGTLQNFATPVTWGPNTSSCIGGGGTGSAISSSASTVWGGAGGGGGAFASDNIGLDRNANTPYFIGGVAQQTWFKSTSALLADCGLTAISNAGAQSAPTPGTGGTIVNSIGAIKRAGGNGGPPVSGSSAGSPTASGAGGGAAGGSTSGGNNGITGSYNSTHANASGGTGGASDTVAGGAGSSGTGGSGNTGTDFDASHGAGSGAAGGGYNGTSNNGGVGGLYGGGGGGSAGASGSGGFTPGGLGRQGMIFLSWSPYIYTEVYNTN